MRATVWIVVTLAGTACALTLLFLGMRAVMDVGGFCAEGGPFEIRQRCPQGVPGIMVGSIWGGIVLAFAYVFSTFRFRVPGFAGLLWPALFLSLGWNFFEFAFDPPGEGSGPVVGWLVCGVLFALMGGLPLLAVWRPTLRSFFGGEERPGPIPSQFTRVAERARRATGSAFVHDLEALERLRRSGVLTDDEFETAKRRLLGDDA